MQEYNMPLRSDMRELVQHGSADFPIQYYVNQLHLVAGGSIPLHWHTSLEFFVVHCGTVLVRAGNSSLTLHQGEGIFINANTLHSYSSLSPEGEKCLCPNVVLSDEFIAPLNSAISRQYVRPVTMDDRIPYALLSPKVSWQGEILSRLDKVFSLLQRCGKESVYGEVPALMFRNRYVSEECFEIEVHCEMVRIWQSIYSHCAEMQHAPANRSEHVIQIRMQKMLGFIHEHYPEDISLRDIAASSSISKSEASRCFQSCLHTSPISYLLRYRVEKAMQLLQNNSETVEAISYECGFSSSAYFCKVFRRQTGMTPNQYRHRNI